MPKFEAVAVDLNVSRLNRTCYMVIDKKTKEPHFEINVWLLNEYNRKLSSYKLLAQRIAQFLNFCSVKGFNPLDFDNPDFEYYLDKYLFQGDGNAEKKRTASTVLQYGSSIVQLYEGLYKLGFVAHPLSIPSHFQNERLERRSELYVGTKNSLDPFDLHKQVLDSVDFNALLGYLGVTTKKAQLRKRNELIMKVAYETGCRASEIVNPWNFSKRRINEALKDATRNNRSFFPLVIVGKGAGAGKHRTIEFPVDLAREISSYLKRFNIVGEAIFTNQHGMPLSSRAPTRIFKDCKDALIRDSDVTILGEERLQFWHTYFQNRTFHSLRHSFATNLVHKLTRLVDGGSLYQNYDHVKQLLGHASIETTKIYVAFDLSLRGSQQDKNQHLFGDLFKNLSEVTHEKSEEFRTSD